MLGVVRVRDLSCLLSLSDDLTKLAFCSDNVFGYLLAKSFCWQETY